MPEVPSGVSVVDCGADNLAVTDTDGNDVTTLYAIVSNSGGLRDARCTFYLDGVDVGQETRLLLTTQDTDYRLSLNYYELADMVGHGDFSIDFDIALL